MLNYARNLLKMPLKPAAADPGVTVLQCCENHSRSKHPPIISLKWIYATTVCPKSFPGHFPQKWLYLHKTLQCGYVASSFVWPRMKQYCPLKSNIGTDWSKLKDQTVNKCNAHSGSQWFSSWKETFWDHLFCPSSFTVLVFTPLPDTAKKKLCSDDGFAFLAIKYYFSKNKNKNNTFSLEKAGNTMDSIVKKAEHSLPRNIHNVKAMVYPSSHAWM